MEAKECLPRAPSKKTEGKIIWGNHSLEAKERFPQTPSKKTDWVKAKNKKSARFSAGKMGGAHQSGSPAPPLRRPEGK